MMPNTTMLNRRLAGPYPDGAAHSNDVDETHAVAPHCSDSAYTVKPADVLEPKLSPLNVSVAPPTWCSPGVATGKLPGTT
jgi:hypothetical protein